MMKAGACNRPMHLVHVLAGKDSCTRPNPKHLSFDPTNNKMIWMYFRPFLCHGLCLTTRCPAAALELILRLRMPFGGRWGWQMAEWATGRGIFPSHRHPRPHPDPIRSSAPPVDDGRRFFPQPAAEVWLAACAHSAHFGRAARRLHARTRASAVLPCSCNPRSPCACKCGASTGLCCGAHGDCRQRRRHRRQVSPPHRAGLPALALRPAGHHRRQGMRGEEARRGAPACLASGTAGICTRAPGAGCRCSRAPEAVL